MNVIELKEHIISNPEKIEYILEAMGCTNIKGNYTEYRCAYEQGGNITGVCVKKDTLFYTYRSNKGIMNGDILTLVMEKKSCNFNEALKYISSILGFSLTYQKKEIHMPFGGFYKKISANKKYDTDLPTYDKSILDQYDNRLSQRFLKDGISLEVQKEFGIRFDHDTGRILIPYFNTNDELVGLVGRLNENYTSDMTAPKYLPLIPFSKSKIIYGYSHNYQSILQKKVLWIAEAEKSTMIAKSNNIHNVLSVGSNHISEIQANYIKSLIPNKVIVAFDEGIEEDYLVDVCQKLKSKTIFNEIQVGYVHDRHNQYLSKGSKLSPFDLGVDTKGLGRDCIKWI